MQNNHPIASDSARCAPSQCYAASPALTHQSKLYPPKYRGRVPKKIKMAMTLYPDTVAGFSLAKPGTMLELNQVYDCRVNQNGAVAGWCDNGEKLGVKPGEFDVVEWHETKPHNDPKLRHGGTESPDNPKP